MRDVVILGSTGSIGTQTLDVIDRNRDRFRVVALSAGGSRLDLLADQVRSFAPAAVAVPDAQAALGLAQRLGSNGPELLTEDGNEALAARPCDVVVNAITGAAGLRPTLVALRAGVTLALANKESLVIGGRLVTGAASPGQLIPIDS